MNTEEVTKAMHFMETVLHDVGNFLMQNQYRVNILDYKDRQDILTDIDVKAEKMVIDAIEKEYPTHSILSEERGLIDKSSEYQWVIDPLDGTKEYVRGIPLFCTSVSLNQKGETILGLNNHAANDNQIFAAAKGLGAFRNDLHIKISSKNKAANSYLYYHTPVASKTPDQLLDKIWQLIPALSKSFYRVRGMAHENLILDWMAAGGAEGYVYFASPGPNWWDVASGLFIFEQAGGKITDLYGNPLKDSNITQGIIACTPDIYDELFQLLSPLRQS